MVLQLEGVSIQLQHHADSSNSSDMLANEVSVSLIETFKIPAYSEIQTMAYTSSTCKGVWLVEGISGMYEALYDFTQSTTNKVLLDMLLVFLTRPILCLFHRDLNSPPRHNHSQLYEKKTCILYQTS